AYSLAGRNRRPVHIKYNSTTMILSVTNRAEDTTYKYTDLKSSTFGLKTSDVTFSKSTSLEVYPNGFANDTLSITISVTQNGSLYKRRVRMSRAGLVKVI